MSWDTILFDLDGTLTDPALGITNSVMYALEKYHIEVADRTTLYPFIGPPLQDSFADYLGVTPEEAMEAVGYFREYFMETGIFENTLLPGIPELLQRLCAAGKTLAVASSKPEVSVRRIMDYFSLTPYFTELVGSELDGRRGTKGEVVEEALLRLGSPERERVLMVGDRKFDVLGAAEFGLRCVGVLYGYGSEEELRTAGAAALVSSVEELGAYLLQN